MNRENILPLVGKIIRVDRGGPESSVGLLLSVGEDYITVLLEEPVYMVKQGNNEEYVSEDEFKKNNSDNNGAVTGRYRDFSVVYYQTQHIKSITQDARKNLATVEPPENFDFVQGENFRSILETMRYQWVKINRGGPERIEGILFEANDDYIVVIRNEEIVRLSMFHVRSLNYSVVKVEDPTFDANENTNAEANNKGNEGE